MRGGPDPVQPLDGGRMIGHFEAIGNCHLLSRLCQWLAGEDALEINYHGMKPANIDQLAKVAAQVEACRTSGEVHVAAN